MIGANLLVEAAEQIQIGQQRLAHATRQLVCQMPSPIARLLDYANDETFLEPWLFAFLSSQDAGPTLEQVLFGALLDRSLLPEFTVHSNSRGTVFLPGIGYKDKDAASCRMVLGHEEVHDEVLDRRAIAGANIELCLEDDALIQFIMRESGGHDFSIDRIDVQKNANTLDRAFEAMELFVQDLCKLIKKVTRRIVLFRSEQLDSFATIRAHGAVFLNLSNQKDTTEVFFIEDLAHQCGHVMFNAMTTNRSDYLAIDPATPLSQLTGAKDESRDVYTALHGVFTEALMCIALHSCMEIETFSESKRHELIGRLSFIMKKFHLDLLGLSRANIFTDRGARMVVECGKVFDAVFRHNEDRITGVDLRNQSYVFSYDRFIERNQLARH